ncbi:MAG: GTPase [Acholeplasmataceae bacterium]
MNHDHVCKGCGAPLQLDDKTKRGYALSLDHEYCQACYRLYHYGEASEHFHPEDLPKLNKDGVAVMVSSVMALDMLFEYPVYRYEPNMTFVYIINQMDLLPKSTNTSLMFEHIMRKAKMKHIPFKDIIFMTAKNPYDIEHLKSYLLSFKKKDIYFIGVQNAGKTTLFNALTEDNKALAMNKAGLTQEAISAKLSDHVTLWDMPGLYQEGYLHQYLSYQQYKKLLPSVEMKPKIFQMRKDQTIFIEGLIAVTAIEPMNMVVYGSRHLEFHKTNALKIDDLLSKKETFFKVYADQYEKRVFKLNKGKQQLTCADFSFMHFTDVSKIEVTYPKGMHITISEALFL